MKPIFERWYQLKIPELGYHNAFDELPIVTVERLEGADLDRSGRDHLNDYHYLGDETFEGIREFIDAYNLNATDFIDNSAEMIKTEITQYAAALEEYSTELNQYTSFYHPSNVQRYIWRRFSNENIRLEITPTSSNEFQLILEPGYVVIATGD